ncbi:MAG: hypothetical protein HQL20_02260 [Candidatus Omnitrophica bacterium]|nr:hypothetical protein [Candidatus Omnitrophota bacterium]
MINIDLVTAVSAYICVVVGVITLWWWFSSGEKKELPEWNPTDHVKRCSYCGHVFLDHQRPSALKCPLCESYLEVSNVVQAKEK